MRRSQRQFGLELEFESPWTHIRKYGSKVIREVYGPRKTYCREECFESDKRLDKWHIKLDGLTSITEVTTPVSTQTDLPKIKKVINKLSKYDVNPTDNCGFHVHLNISDMDQYHFMAGWMVYEKAIFSCFPLDRRKSTHCQKIIESANSSRSYIAKLLERAVDNSSHSDALSLTYYTDRNTVEVRIAEGTDDGKFIMLWVEFLLAFADYIKHKNPCLISCNKCNCADFHDMMRDIKMKSSVYKFMTERYEKYGKLPYWVY